MALSNPEQPELKRFTFFVSRRFEEGRERFRLHMGYFPTLAEAEEWLGAVRDIYRACRAHPWSSRGAHNEKDPYGIPEHRGGRNGL